MGRDTALVRRRGLAIASPSVSDADVWVSAAPRGCPARLRGFVAVRSALPRLAHGRSRLCHPGPVRRRLRAAAPTAESGRVARWSGPQGPRHRRPWLRHRFTPPRPCLRGVQATPGSRTSRHKGMPVCAAARGPVSAAAETAPPLDCPRALLGCQATFRPPVGSATRSNRHCALPYLSAPRGAQRQAPAPLRSARVIAFSRPHTPSRGLCRSLALLAVTVASPPCQLLGAGRRWSAALSVLPRRSRPAPESGAARPASVPLLSWLPP